MSMNAITSFKQKETKSVLIAIQARSTSTRYPQKIYQLIGKKSVLQHVIDKAKDAQSYVERSSHKVNIKVNIAILHPEEDNQLIDKFRNSGIALVGGDEGNVLSRYSKAMDIFQPDYIVRLTSDCPLMIPGLISKHINTAIYNNLDYVNNVDQRCRTIADGFDCEIMSKKAMDWLKDNATSSDEKEHVTLALRAPDTHNLKMGFVMSQLHTSREKLSVDTEKDLENIRAVYHAHEVANTTAMQIYGRSFVYVY